MPNPIPNPDRPYKPAEPRQPAVPMPHMVHFPPREPTVPSGRIDMPVPGQNRVPQVKPPAGVLPTPEISAETPAPSAEPEDSGVAP